MRIVKAENYNEMCRKAASIIASEIIIKPDCVLGLATGSTPIGVYENLVRDYENGLLDFSKVTTVNLDEYKGLDQNNDQSYYYFMNHHLFGLVNIMQDRIHLPDGIIEDNEKACKEYDEILAKCGRRDIQLLGLGHNGHIGFNEPSTQFDLHTHCVKLSESTIEANKRFFSSTEEVPQYAYTMGIMDIMKAKCILLLVCGTDKAKILEEALNGPVTPAVPASILQLHDNLIVIADSDALSQFEWQEGDKQ